MTFCSVKAGTSTRPTLMRDSAVYVGERLSPMSRARPTRRTTGTSATSGWRTTLSRGPIYGCFGGGSNGGPTVVNGSVTLITGEGFHADWPQRATRVGVVRVLFLTILLPG